MTDSRQPSDPVVKLEVVRLLNVGRLRENERSPFESFKVTCLVVVFTSRPTFSRKLPLGCNDTLMMEYTAKWLVVISYNLSPVEGRKMSKIPARRESNGPTTWPRLRTNPSMTSQKFTADVGTCSSADKTFR